MKARLSINYNRNDLANINCRSECIDMELQCPINKGETFHFAIYGYEWMGECTNVHHLLGEIVKNGNSHLPMFTLVATAIRKIPT